MPPKGHFDLERAKDMVSSAKQYKVEPSRLYKFIMMKPVFSGMHTVLKRGIKWLKNYMKDMQVYQPCHLRKRSRLVRM